MIQLIENMLAEVSFGEWLKRQRNTRGLNREQLAHQIGCAVITLRKMEAEERRPSMLIVERLAEIFNIPSNERISFLRFARGDWGSAPSMEMEDAPWHTSTKSPRSNLPAPTTSLVGRQKEIVDVRDYLLRADIRLVTLVGPPGIGKTRLSLEAARASLFDFPDGVFFVSLAPLDDSNLIASRIAQTLGFVEIKRQSHMERLKNGIGDNHMLLVLDNCEHLIESAASLIAGILPICSRLKILTTSREALRVPGEWIYPVPTLDVPKETSAIDMETASTYPALTLFAERARAVRSDFSLNADNLQSVASICNQLDGLPLAIELIAARIRLMSPQALLAKLNEQIVLSTDGMRAVPARQRTLQNAINWSYNLLSPEEQNLFVRLAVFTGGFTLDAAEAIFSRTVTNKSVSDYVASLSDKSLLQHTLDSHGEPRFNMLFTIHQFARDHLRRMNEAAEIRHGHLAYFLDLAEKADKEIHGPHQVIWIDRVEMEHDNFRAALEWCMYNQKTEYALRLLGALGWPWHMRGHYNETRSWFARIHALPEATDHPMLYARLLNHHGRQSWLLGEYHEAQSVLNESQAVWMQLGVQGERGLAEALNFLGMVARSSEGDKKTAQSLFERSLELYQRYDDQRGMASVMFNLGWIADARNDDALALSLFEQSLELFRQLGDIWGMGRVSSLLGQLFLKQESYEKARVYFEQGLKLDESLHLNQGIVGSLGNLGDLYRYQGNYDQARYFYEKSLSMCQKYGLKMDGCYNLYSLGMLALHRRNYLLAKQLFIDYYNSGREFAERIIPCSFLNGWAAIAAGTNEPERAARLSGAAKAISHTIDYQIPPFDRAEFDRHIKIAREQLGAAKFEELAAEGRAMTLEQAIEYALEISTSL